MGRERAGRDRSMRSLSSVPKALIEASPRAGTEIRRRGPHPATRGIPSRRDPPPGLPFPTGAGAIEGLCSTVKPELVEVAPDGGFRAIW